MNDNKTSSCVCIIYSIVTRLAAAVGRSRSLYVPERLYLFEETDYCSIDVHVPFYHRKHVIYDFIATTTVAVWRTFVMISEGKNYCFSFLASKLCKMSTT